MRRCSALRRKHTTSSAARPHTLYPYTLEKTTEAITDTKAIAARVTDKLLNGIHIGSLGSHIDVDKLNSERLADSEMAVISGHCTDKLDILLMRPRLLNADCAVEHEPCKLVVHDIERGVACNNDICGGDAENV